MIGPDGGGARLRAMLPVSSASNLSRSASATACGDVKVKLWPPSLLTNPIFSRTCSAPTLLRERASMIGLRGEEGRFAGVKGW